MCVTGVVLSGVAVSFFKSAIFGVDPFQALMSGLDALIPIQYGTLYVIVNAVLLLFSIVFDRKKIGLGTLINLFLLGYIVQFGVDIIAAAAPHPALWLRIIFLAIGVFIACIAASLYFTADMGVSTYDAIAIALSGKWKLAPFQYCRIATDVICVVSGCVLFLLAGGTFGAIPTIAGAGTIITAFFMGPLIELFNVKIARPLLKKS